MSRNFGFRVVALVAMLSLVAVLGATTYQSVPKPVTEFYTDVMGMFGKLMKDLGAAKEAKAVAKAFRTATETAQAKKLGPRYQSLSKQYKEFFVVDDNDAGTANLPPDWEPLYRGFEKQMMAYGENAGNLVSFMGTPEVESAMEAFDAVMQQLSQDTGD